MAGERLQLLEEQAHIAQFGRENKFPAPQPVFLDGVQVGEIRYERGTISGASKRFFIPQLAIKTTSWEKGETIIPVLAANGRAVAAANPEKRDEFNGEAGPYSELNKGSNRNILLTEKVGRPSSIPQQEKTPDKNNGYFSTESAAGSIALERALSALASLNPHMLDQAIGLNAVNLRLFKQAMLFKFLGGAFSALEELHTTCDESTNDPDNLTVYVHEDMDIHAGNVVVNLVPGRSTFGNALLIDLARVKKTTIRKMEYKRDVNAIYANNPDSAITKEHKEFEDVVRANLNYSNLPDLFPEKISRAQVWTGALFDELYLHIMGELQRSLGRQQDNFDKFEKDIQERFFTAYVGSLLYATEKDNVFSYYALQPEQALKRAQAFAKAITDEFLVNMKTEPMQAIRPPRRDR